MASLCCRLFAPDHQQFANVLHRCGTECVTDARQQDFTLLAFGFEDADLDQAVRPQVALDFGQYGFRQPFLADADYRGKAMGGGA